MNPNTMNPAFPLLPEQCYFRLQSTGEVVLLKRGETGYFSVTKPGIDPTKMNVTLGVTPAQVAAMKAGAMFGWDCPAANPANYNAEGKIIRRTKGSR